MSMSPEESLGLWLPSEVPLGERASNLKPLGEGTVHDLELFRLRRSHWVGLTAVRGVGKEKRPDHTVVPGPARSSCLLLS
jgi:hypothetical protein